MGKITIKNSTFAGLAASQEFNTLRTPLQIGDQFYVPRAEMLLVLGTDIPASKDDKGREYPARVAAQYFPVVRMDGDKPIEVTNLYVGQLVKVDAKRAIAFPNELSTALRKGSDAFKEMICDRILETTESKEIQDRVWDEENTKWATNDDGKTLKTQTKDAFKFEVKKHNLTPEIVNKCEEMLSDYIKANYADLAEA